MVTNKKLIWSIVIVTIILIVLVGRNYAAAFFLKKGMAAFEVEDELRAKINITIASILSPKNPVAWAYLGHLARGIKPDLDSENPYHDSNFKKAVWAYEKAFSYGIQNEIPPIYFNVLASAALAYYQLGEYDKGLNLYLKVIDLFPGETAFGAKYFVAYDYFNRLNKPTEALNYLISITSEPHAILNVDKNSFKRIYLHLARAYLYFENYEAAKDATMIIIRSADSKTDKGILETAHLYLAYIDGKDKNFKSVETHMQEVKNNGSDELFNCGLAYAYFLGVDYKEAYEKARSIKKFDRTIPQLLCLKVLGESSQAMGDKTNAKKYFEEYLKLIEPINNKNAFLIRNREKFQKYLQ